MASEATPPLLQPGPVEGPVVPDHAESYRRIVENALEGIWAMDGRFVTTFVNGRMALMLGYEPGEMLGRPVTDFMFSEQLEDHARRMEERTAGRDGVYERRFRRRDGSELWAIVAATALRGADGGFAGSFAFFTDITARRALEATLEAKRDELEAIYASAPVMMCVLDGRRNVVFANPAFSAFTGVPVDKLRQGRACGVFGCVNAGDDPRGCGFGPSCGSCALRLAIEETLATGRPHRDVECRATLVRYGITRPVALLGATARLRAEGPDQGARVLLCLQDLTPRLKAEEALRESERRYRELFENAVEGIYQSTPEGRYLRVNPAFARSAGYGSPEEMIEAVSDIGTQMWVDPSERRRLGTLLAERGSVRGFEAEIRRRDGNHVWVSINATAVRDATGRIVSYDGTTEDVTDRRSARERLLRLNEELEERVRERTAELTVANRELEAFSYSVSHDLRAPLRAIAGFGGAVLESAGDALDAEARSDLERVLAAAERMSRLIDGLLGLSRVTRQEMARQNVDLSTVAADVLRELQAAARDRGVTAVVAAGLHADGDPELLRLLLRILLENAWKFTGRKAQARIEVGALPDGGGFFVRDDGAGFDAAHTGKLFGPFQRLHGETEFPGHGIGLATAQRIVHRHGGRIWAEGAPGAGAFFGFTLGPAAALPTG